MKRTIIIILSFISLVSVAQESRTIGGNLLNGSDSFEEIDPAVLNEDKVRYKEVNTISVSALTVSRKEESLTLFI